MEGIKEPARNWIICALVLGLKLEKRDTCLAVLERASHKNEELMVVVVKEVRCQHFCVMGSLNKNYSWIVVVEGKGLLVETSRVTKSLHSMVLLLAYTHKKVQGNTRLDNYRILRARTIATAHICCSYFGRV